MDIAKTSKPFSFHQLKAENIHAQAATITDVKTTKEFQGPITLHGINSDSANFSWRGPWSWPQLSSGDCACGNAQAWINTNGQLFFNSFLTSSAGNDSWGVLHIDFYQDNGFHLFSSDSHWSPTIPSGGEQFSFYLNYPQYMFAYVSGMNMTYHC